MFNILDSVPRMAKRDSIGIRLEPELKATLLRLAAEDQRSLSSLVCLILNAWITEKSPDARKHRDSLSNRIKEPAP